MTKQCKECKIVKNTRSFHKDAACKDGRKSACKICRRKKVCEWAAANRHIAKAWRDANVQYRKDQYYANWDYNREVRRRWHRNNRKKSRAALKKWANNNKGVGNYYNTLRYLKQKKPGVIPKWLTEQDLIAIKAIYIKASELQKETGVRMSVDHIIPLHGKEITGLHVLSNLQIIPLVENIKKANKFL